MGPKLLFLVGIIVAHGALAAGWVSQEAPGHRNSIATCVQAPAATPHFETPRELLAMADIPIAELRAQQP
ncbi:MAG TPA: hypothetical protein VFU13_10170 [Steroidobacteraceae bacterium]|nr:hypothetical protein [Steroidobacteraceae bacterium]